MVGSAAHAHRYYQKNGTVTREATVIDDAVRFLRKHHGTMFLEDFGPVVLDELGNGMISELHWSRKHINKQVSRLTRMFTWAAEKELVSPALPLALKSLAGLKKGRCNAREMCHVLRLSTPRLRRCVKAMIYANYRLLRPR